MLSAKLNIALSVLSFAIKLQGGPNTNKGVQLDYILFGFSPEPTVAEKKLGARGLLLLTWFQISSSPLCTLHFAGRIYETKQL